MAMTGGQVRAGTNVTAKGTFPPPGVISSDPLRDTRITQLADVEVTPLIFGTGSGCIDHTTVSDREIAAGSSATYDLYTGTDLTDLASLTAAFRNVKFVQISIVSGGDTSGVRIGGASSNEWVGFFVSAGDQLDIFPGGPPYVAGSPAGKAVGSATKNLKIANSGAVAVTVRVVVSGSTVVAGMLMGILGLTYP